VAVLGPVVSSQLAHAPLYLLGAAFCRRHPQTPSSFPMMTLHLISFLWPTTVHFSSESADPIQGLPSLIGLLHLVYCAHLKYQVWIGILQWRSCQNIGFGIVHLQGLTSHSAQIK